MSPTISKSSSGVSGAKDLGWGPERYNHASNIVARIHEDHAIKTAKIDIPAIAKGNRITAMETEFRRKLLAKVGQGDADQLNDVVKKPGSRLRSAPMPGSRKSKFRRRMSGAVERRE